MTTSYNGWFASENPDAIGIVPLVVAGEPFTPGVRGGDVKTVLQYVATQFHLRVEPLVRSDWHQADDWGWYYRANVNNPSVLSCHSSGTAIDINATRHPNGRAGTFTYAQIRVIRAILSEVSGVVRWGGDFSGTPDDMHWEICKDAAAVAIVARNLRAGTTTATPTTTEDPMNATQYAEFKAAIDGLRRDQREMANMLNEIAGTVGETVRLNILKGATNDGTIES